MTLQVSPIFNKNIKNLKSSVQKVTDIFATEKNIKWKPHLNRIKLWRHNDVFRDEKRVIAPNTLSKKI